MPLAGVFSFIAVLGEFDHVLEVLAHRGARFVGVTSAYGGQNCAVAEVGHSRAYLEEWDRMRVVAVHEHASVAIALMSGFCEAVATSVWNRNRPAAGKLWSAGIAEPGLRQMRDGAYARGTRLDQQREPAGGAATGRSSGPVSEPIGHQRGSVKEPDDLVGYFIVGLGSASPEVPERGLDLVEVREVKSNVARDEAFAHQRPVWQEQPEASGVMVTGANATAIAAGRFVAVVPTSPSR